MKKVIFTALMSLFICTIIDAQILRVDELENYAKEKYREKWVDAAENLGQQLLAGQEQQNNIRSNYSSRK
ncbi:hypothetical protein [uncultured Bacteroides sp.]|uniref:hypothetical protein n=1 Tax=uncultured Bacteroides sp. TaxID=162156 RepID=UPI00260E6434|nr:hypothetical protein [uncultured Bacteroides sp.]